jgi:hypothetical protein
MIRIIYGAGGHSMRDVSPAKVDVRDIGDDGRPHPSLLRCGDKLAEVKDEAGYVTHHLFDHVEPTRIAEGEREFDHVLTPAELEKEFPGYAARVKEQQRVGALRAAVALAAEDDELVAMVSAGALKASDLHDLDAINERRKLRGKSAIG